MTLQDLISKHLKRRSPLSDLINPLSSLNAIIQTQRRKRLSARAWHAPRKVVSIGNIVAGGSGKTPFCIYLAGLLRDKGLRVGVSHRGYKGVFENTPTLISNRDDILPGAELAGDEAYLIASRLPGIPVGVGKQRTAAVSLLLAQYSDLDIVLLDDAFQHRGIARDLDIVCFDVETGCGNGRLLPAGYLREPLSALDAASLLVVTHKRVSRGAEAESVWWEGFHLPVIHCWLQSRDGITAEGKTVEVAALQGKRLLLISGIADPDSFEDTVRAMGLDWLHHFRCADHHAFSNQEEIRRMAYLADKYKVDRLLCTEKDLAKLARHAELRENLVAVRMDLVCDEEEALMGLIKLKLAL